MDEGKPYSLRIRDCMDGIPSVRWEKVARIQRLMASDHWPPRGEAVVDRLLFEHLLGPLHP